MLAADPTRAPRSARARSAARLLALALLLAAGCKERTIRYEVAFEGGKLPRSVRYRLLFRGQELQLGAPDASGVRKASFSARGERRFSRDPRALKLEVATPCGFKPYSWREPGGASDRAFLAKMEDDAAATKKPYEVTFWMPLDLPTTMLVTVDRRRAGSGARIDDAAGALSKAKVAVGEQPLPPEVAIPDGKGSRGAVGEVFLIYRPTCERGRRVTVDGKPIGTLPDLSRKSDVLVMIDVAGGHCYEKKHSSYSTTPGAPAPGGPTKQIVRGQRVIAIDNAPPSLGVLGGDPWIFCPMTITNRLSCTQLYAADCGG